MPTHQDHAAFLEDVGQFTRALDTLDYYQILEVDYEADHSEIRAAYHRKARRYHPDRFHHLNLPNLHSALTLISKRVTEAYVTLRSPRTRRLYTEAVCGSEREQRLRYREQDERQHKDQEQAQMGKTPQVQQFYHAACKAHADGDLEGAVKNLKMALMFERDNEHFKTLLAEWQPPPAGS